MTRFATSIRRARPEEASQLSDLAFRSKALWGYDARFLDVCRQELTITETAIRHRHIFVFEDERGITNGFYTLLPLKNRPGVADLDFFVEPGRMNRGCGRSLWEHAVRSAIKIGYERIHVETDPYAEVFYLKMGAVRSGTTESPAVPGRMLSLMSFCLLHSNLGQPNQAQSNQGMVLYAPKCGTSQIGLRNVAGGRAETGPLRQ